MPRPPHAADQREQQTLGQKLAQEAAASGADGRTDRDLARPAGSPDQQQVGNVGAGAEQHATHGAEQDIQGGAHVAHQKLLHGFDREAILGPERPGIRALELFRRQAHCAPGCPQGNALQPRYFPGLSP